MASFWFYFSAAATLLSALGVVLQRSAMSSALSLILCMGGVALLYFQLGAGFIAVTQLIVYAGAIMVLFLFVIMLLEPASERQALTPGRIGALAVMIGVMSGLLLLRVLRYYRIPPDAAAEREPADMTALGARLFSKFVLPFEVTSVLILVAIIGAVILAKKKL